MKTILSILILVCITLTAKATSQIGDVLIWKGDTLKLFSNPLELRPDWNKLSKTIYSELEKQDRQINPKKYKSKAIETIYSTACPRGYFAEWKIINNKIYLSNIFSCNDYKVKVNLKEIFPNKIRENLVFANWVTGKLFVPKGHCIEQANLGDNSIYEKEIVLSFKEGQLINTKTYHNYVEKKSKFSLDPNPNDYLKFIYSKVDWGKLPDLKSQHIQVFVGILPEKNGKINRILSDYTYLLDSNGIITNRNNIYIKEAIRVAKLIPTWDVVYQRGKIARRNFTIVFDENNRKKYAR